MMTDPTALFDLLTRYGYLGFLLLSVVEGPIVTVMAAALAQQGGMDLRLVLLLAVLGDLLGDVLVHLAGRFAASALPVSLQRRLRIERHVLQPLVDTFACKGGRVLVLAKLTHFAGFPVLFASGVARMPFPAFLIFSLLACLPKVALLCALGLSFGLTVARLPQSSWLAPVAAGVLCCTFAIYTIKQGRPCARP